MLLLALLLPFGLGFALGRFVRRKILIVVLILGGAIFLVPAGLLLGADECGEGDECHGGGVGVVVAGLLVVLVAWVAGVLLGAFVRNRRERSSLEA